MNVVPQPTPTAERGTEHGADLFLWSRERARPLEVRRFDELDLPSLADEVRALGASEEREIRNRLVVPLMPLLGWRHQPERRSGSWQVTIDGQREKLHGMLDDDPSLRGYPAQVMSRAYGSARLKAAKETGLDFAVFAEAPPFTAEQALDPDSLPTHSSEDIP